MARLFGFSIENNDETPKSVVSPVPPSQEDGNDHYMTAGFFGNYVDLEGVYKNEFDLIRRYREMALHPEVDSAIEDVVHEFLSLIPMKVQLKLNFLNSMRVKVSKTRSEKSLNISKIS